MENLSVIDCDRYLLFEFSGPFDVIAGKQVVDEMLKACAEYGRNKCVLDCRAMTGPMPLMARFEVIEYGQRLRGKVAQLAMVGLPGTMLPDRFVENVAVNRGVNLRLFSDLDEAVAWLGAL